MIVVMEAYWRGLSHATGNATTIRVARAAYPDEPITFLAEKTHIAAVREELPDMTHFETVEIDIPTDEASIYRRLVPDWRNVRRAFARMRGADRSTLILCSAYGSMLALCGLARRPPDRVLARLHGNLNEIIGPPARNPIRRALSLHAGLDRVGRAEVKLVVLEESVRRELIALRPGLKTHVEVLEELAAVDLESGAPPRDGEPVRFAFLGVGTRDKGADRFLAAAGAVREKVGDKAAFELIGRLHTPLKHLSTAMLSRPPNESAIPRTAFIERIRQQHYVCALYEPEYYRLAASGVLLDAITHRKPLIVTDIPFAQDLFARFGDLGEICRSQDEVVSAISRLATQVDPERYRRQVQNLERVAASRDLTTLAAKLRAMT
jgi:hypothetical protein